ncbi:heavy metal-binding domain-containing protein [Mucilaginibacter terrae]|uniref:heavy metal-binding domain-containing protein n=1 Tax=Mucilaginibacter terrae TaxID=1955052 RepID=UPI003644E0EC
MKKLSIICLMVALTACTPSTPNETKTAVPAGQQINNYTCTMHPDVKVDKPGTCPKCGMGLVEVEN